MPEKKPEPLSAQVRALRFRNDGPAGNPTPFQARVVREEPLALFINDEPYATLMRLPGREKELVLGFLFSEGIIESLADVLYLRHCSSESRNRVQVKLAARRRPGMRRNIEARSACGLCSRTLIDDLERNIAPLPAVEAPLVSFSVLAEIERGLSTEQVAYKKTGGGHAAALYNREGELLALAEDIGRHNALDKVIGFCLLRGWNDLGDKILVSTGRASFEMVYKSLRARVALLACVSAPTSLALEMAHRFGLTLVGFLRQDGFNAYTFPQRIAAI